MKTHKRTIRIAVVTGADGHWNSSGWGGPASQTDDENFDFAINGLDMDGPFIRSFVEVEVEFPDEPGDPPVAQGTVVEVEP